MQSGSTFQDISSFTDQISSGFFETLPNIVLAVIVLLVGIFIAWIVRIIVKRIILYAQKKINLRMREKLMYLDFSGSELFISKTFFWIIIVITLAIDSSILEFEFLSAWINSLVTYVPNILAVVLIIFFGIIASRLIGELLGAALERAGISNSRMLGRLVRYIILFISIIIAIDQIGIDIIFLTNLLTITLAALFFGAALAFGLGAKGSVNNILGSYYLKKIYKEGNTVRVGDVEGIIVKILPTTVLLQTEDGQVSIPAKDFNENTIVMIKKD